MAAVLHPFLHDSVLAEAMLSMIWHFHGLEAQTDTCRLSVEEDVCESTGRMALRVRSTQHGWPIQVVQKNTNKDSSNNRHLKLSDSTHTVWAVISNDAVRRWEYQSEQCFDDILPGTILQVNISEVVFRPIHGASKKTSSVPYVVLQSFKFVGCQGENIFGRPNSLHREPKFEVIHHALGWWSARKFQSLAEEHGVKLIQSHDTYAKKQGNQLSDQYLSWLHDQLATDQSDDDMRMITKFAKNIPAVSDVLSYSQQIGLSASIPSASNRLNNESHENKAPNKTAWTGAAVRKANDRSSKTGKGKKSENKQARGRLRGQSIISIEDDERATTANVISESPSGPRNYTASTPPPAEALQQGSVSVSNGDLATSPLFSPFARRDAKIRKQQRGLVTDKNEASWVMHGASSQQLPEAMLEAFVSQLRVQKSQQRTAWMPVTQGSAASSALDSIELDDQQIPASQRTVASNDWPSSPVRDVLARTLPPDTPDGKNRDDDANAVVVEDEGSVQSADEVGAVEEAQAIVDDTADKSNFINQPRIDLEQGIAEPAGFSLGTQSASPTPTPAPQPVSTPSTPVVQIPASALSAPDTVQVPATTSRAASKSTARKRRSEEFEADNIPEPSIVQTLGPPTKPSPMEDPVERSKRDRAAFMAECQAERIEAPKSSRAPPSSSAPTLSTTPLAAPVPIAPPTGLHAQFTEIYPTYSGSSAHFAALARVAAIESAAGHLPQYALDEFVLRHHTAYEPFAAARIAEGAVTVPDYVTFFAQEVQSLGATRGVLNAQNVALAAAEGTKRETKKKRVKEGGGERSEKRRNASKVFAAFAKKK